MTLTSGQGDGSVHAGACDTHVHVIGPPAQYPMTAQRQYTPDTASTTALQQHLQRQGLQRVVVVQPSVYGFDNRCLCDALHTLGPQARGIAVCDPSVSNAELQQLDACGVRGLRLNFESAHNHDAQALQHALQTWAPRLADLGWHVQVYAPFAATVACAAVIAQLPIPVVLDHVALWPVSAPDRQHSEAEHTLLALLKEGNIYIKLSASYRLPAWTSDALQALAHRLLHTRSDRLLWGSDWPHTNREPGVQPHQVSRYRRIDAQHLIDEQEQWLNTPAWRQAVLVDNPARLYRFETSPATSP